MKKFNCLLLCLIAIAIFPVAATGRTEAAIEAKIQIAKLPEDIGYYDFSADKATVFLNQSKNYNKTAFFDFYSPVRPGSLRTADELSKYDMQDPWISSDKGAMMLSLDELSRIYAPYFTYGTDESGNITIRHITYIKSGKMYIKTLWSASITGADFIVTKCVGETAKASELDNLQLSETEVVSGALSCAAIMEDNKVYVPVDLLKNIGKIIIDQLGYTSIVTDFGDSLKLKSAASTWLGWETISENPITWADYMDGVLDGSITKGHFWRSLYVGTVDLYTNEDYGNDAPSNPKTVVNRITSYRYYVPEVYDPAVPHKMTFMLHGRSSNQNTPFDNPSSHDISIADLAEEFGYIILSPNGWTVGPLWGRGPARHHILKSFEDIKTILNIDDNKVCITGNSQGGHGTLAFASHMPQMFQAYAPTNLVYFHVEREAHGQPRDMLEPVYLKTLANLPGIIAVSTDDTTMPFIQLSPWGIGIKESGVLKKTLFTTIESGTHSQGWASKIPQIFTMFDRAIYGPDMDLGVVEIELKPENTTNREGTAMVKLSYLENVFGTAMSVFEISAKATVRGSNEITAQTTAQNIVLGYENINIVLNKKIYRINQERYNEDAIHMKTEDQGSLEAAPQFSVAPYLENDEIFVPAVEVLEALGCTLEKLNSSGSNTIYKVVIN